MIIFHFAVGFDYESINEELSFTFEDEQKCFSFLPINDALGEPTENITIIASSANSSLRFALIGNEITISITDNGE